MDLYAQVQWVVFEAQNPYLDTKKLVLNPDVEQKK